MTQGLRAIRRIFFLKGRHERFPICMTDHRTVAFRTRYADHYRAAGLAVPDDAKVGANLAQCSAYLRSPEGVVETTRALGFYPRL